MTGAGGGARLATAERRGRDPRRSGATSARPRRSSRPLPGCASPLPSTTCARSTPSSSATRSSARERPPTLAATEAPPARLGGARLGDHRAAHRVVARGGHPAPHGPPLGRVESGGSGHRATSAARRADRRDGGGPRPGRSSPRATRPLARGHSDGQVRAGGGLGPRGPGRPCGRRALRADQRDRPVDAPMPRPGRGDPDSCPLATSPT